MSGRFLLPFPCTRSFRQIGKAMKRFAIFLMSLFLTGCGLRGVEKDLYRKDTVIYIPADPTTVATEEVTEPPETEPTENMAKPEISFFSSIAEKFNKPSTMTTKPATKETEPATIATALPTMESVQTEDGYLERSMMDRVNSHRREAGLTELQISDRLCAIASVRAYEGSQSWSHQRPDGRDYATIFQDYGYSAGTVGENLLYTSGGEDGDTLVSKWMAAETNRDNLMYDGFTTIGIGTYKANGYVYIACLLAG